MARLIYPKFESFHFGNRERFRKTIQDIGSPTAMSALDSLDAALWLLVSEMIPQSLFMLHHTIELALKGLLEEIHVILTADRPTYDLAKWIAREKLSSHRLGKTSQNLD